MNTPSQAALELPPGKLYHDKEEFGDWGWIRAEGSPALVAVVKWPGPTEEECERHRSAGTDPHQPMVNRIIQCYNACAGITDPAAHITGLENQLEAWETSAKLRDDGLCPTQREVIADQQAQIERLEGMQGMLICALQDNPMQLHPDNPNDAHREPPFCVCHSCLYLRRIASLITQAKEGPTP